MWPVEVFLIRHAATVDETLELRDPFRHLTPAGREQAKSLGDRLRWHDCLPTHFWTSPLVRAVQTAELVAAGLQLPIAVDVLPTLAPGESARAVLATLNLVIAGQPWGVVYGFGLWAAKGAQALGLFDPTQNAFWGDAGNARILAQSALLDVTSITNIGLLGGALWVSARKPPHAKPLTPKQWAIGLVAGFVLGYSSRLAFGCNVGALFSGISTGSVHGWIWLPMAFAGTLIGVRVRRHFDF